MLKIRISNVNNNYKILSDKEVDFYFSKMNISISDIPVSKNKKEIYLKGLIDKGFTFKNFKDLSSNGII